MNTNFDLKKIWSSQSVGSPNVAEIYTKAKKMKQKLKREAIATISLITVCLLGIIICIIYELNGQDTSTQMLVAEIGFGLILTAILIFGVDMLRFILLLKKSDAANSSDALQQMLQIKNKLNTGEKSRAVCIILDMAGVLLLLLLICLDEQISLLWCIALFLLVIGLFVFMWFYIRKKRFVRQQTKLNNIIRQLEELKDA